MIQRYQLENVDDQFIMLPVDAKVRTVSVWTDAPALWVESKNHQDTRLHWISAYSDDEEMDYLAKRYLGTCWVQLLYFPAVPRHLYDVL